MPVQAAKLAPLGQRRFGKAIFWRPSPNELQLWQSDWEELMGMIGAGASPLLTAHQGQILQVRPKAANAARRTLAPGADGPELVLPLGFYLRASFTAKLIKP